MQCSKKISDSARAQLGWPICHWVHWWNCGLGTGFIPYAPGTCGSLLALVLMVFIQPYPLLFGCITGASLLLSLWSIPKTTNQLNQHDPKSVVCDEVVGQWIAGLIIWPFLNQGVIPWFICFFGFRFFDVIKPGPVGWFDRMENDFGVLMDDVVAGLMAGGVSFLCLTLCLTLPVLG